MLPKTVGGTKVHLLLGVKNTLIQPVLIRVLPSGVGVYLSPFKYVGGSIIIFAGPSKVFTQANKDQQTESNHAVYSLNNSDILGNSDNCGIGWGVRFESNRKIKSYPIVEPSKEEIDVSCSDKAVNLSKNTIVISSAASAEPARVQTTVKFDLKIQKINYLGNTNVIDLTEFRPKEGSRTKKLAKSSNLTSLINEVKIKKGSKTKIDKSLDLTFLIKVLFMFTSLYFSTLGTEEFQTKIEERRERVRSKPSNPEQEWLIPQPSRSSWGDTKEFNKVSLVTQIIGNKPRINNKNDNKCMTNISKRLLRVTIRSRVTFKV